MSTMEAIVRPWVSVDSTSKPRTPTAPEEEFPESFIRWGAASEFAGDDTFRADAMTPGSLRAEPQPLNLTFTEEARTWTDFKFPNPEDDAQFVILRKVDAIAFALPGKPGLGLELDHDQAIFTFQNDYTAASPVPPYLHNGKNVEFEPLVLDPFHTVIEVGWSAGFVVIAIEVRPRTVVDFAMDVRNPRQSGGIYAPGFERGDPEIDQNPQTPEHEENTPFIEQRAAGSIVDNTSPGQPTVPKDARALGMGDPDSGLPFLHFTGEESRGVGQLSLGGDTVLMFETAEGADGNAPNYGIGLFPGDGAVIDTGAELVHYQYKIDAGVENSLRAEAGVYSTSSGILHEIGNFNIHTAYFYRKWEVASTVAYDDKPFVYTLFFVDVALLIKVLGPELLLQGSNDELTLGILAGHGDDPENAQNAQGGHFTEQTGRLRWSWHSGSSREAFETFIAALPEYSSDNPPTYDEVWEDLHFMDGLINEDEEGFPAGGTIEGDVDLQVKYTANFATRMMEKEHV